MRLDKVLFCAGRAQSRTRLLEAGCQVPLLCAQVSGNHRLDDSKAERERVAGAGAEVAQSEVLCTPCTRGFSRGVAFL